MRCKKSLLWAIFSRLRPRVVRSRSNASRKAISLDISGQSHSAGCKKRHTRQGSLSFVITRGSRAVARGLEAGCAGAAALGRSGYWAGLRGTIVCGIEGAAGWEFGPARDGPSGLVDTPLDPMTAVAVCTTVQPGPGLGIGTGVTAFGPPEIGFAERELDSMPGAVAGTALAVEPGIEGRGTGVILAGGLLAPSGLGLRETPVSRIRNG